MVGVDFRRKVLIVVVCIAFTCNATSQSNDNSSEVAQSRRSKCTDLSGEPITCPDDQTPKAGRASSTGNWSREKSLPKNLFLDQKDFWTSPLRFRPHDLKWAVPFAGATAGLLATDTDIEKHLPSNPNTIKRAQDFSKYGVAGFAGVVGGSYLWGRFTHDDHLRRTGLLSGEAAVGTLVSTLPIKLVSGRDRPLEGDGTGKFWQGHLSFPSEHSAAAWSIASVFAHEYPSLPMQALAYSAATAMTASRVIGRKHWSSDAFVGSALGWYFGQQVYKRHEESESADDAYGTFKSAAESEHPGNITNMGSPYVPLDSWVYPAFDRLAALGYVQTAFMGLRPWTRMECGRLVEEAGGLLDSAAEANFEDAQQILDSLKAEFAKEASPETKLTAKVESVYARVTTISGPPLTDGFHFGQTVINDYGRPFSRGGNVVTGTSMRATLGPLAFYLRGEYQHSPALLPVSDALAKAIANVDGSPALLSTSRGTISRIELLDSYVSLGLHRFQVSFGKQSLWWGPTNSGPFLISNNATPITMLRFSEASPVKLPSILHLLGPIRTEFFIGQLSGHHLISPQNGTFVTGNFDPQPFIHGQKISFKPSPNLEFSISRTTLFGGPGFPFTWSRFARSTFSTGNSYGPNDPGDRRSGFDFSYRIPKLRRYLLLYADSFADDEISPIAYPRRSAMNPGVYVAQLPHLPRLDLRVEGVYTNLPGLTDRGFFYMNTRYRSGYTNEGSLIGSWIGRQGRGVQAWTTYWISPASTIQVGYRAAVVDKTFLSGGRISDFSSVANLRVHPGFSVLGEFQYERWALPLLASGPQSDIKLAVQLTLWPQWGK